jgi:DNA mismatch endonuclease (patch repair protein)
MAQRISGVDSYCPAKIGFRLQSKSLPGTPDIVLRKHKTVVEICGCFFHRHSDCKRASTPSSNRRYWQAKFRRNIARDESNRRALLKLGWRTVVVWECELGRPERLERRIRKIFGL